MTKKKKEKKEREREREREREEKKERKGKESPTVRLFSLTTRTPAVPTLLFLSLSRRTKICTRASLHCTNRTLTLRNIFSLRMQNTFSPVLDSAANHYFDNPNPNSLYVEWWSAAEVRKRGSVCPARKIREEEIERTFSPPFILPGKDIWAEWDESSSLVEMVKSTVKIINALNKNLKFFLLQFEPKLNGFKYCYVTQTIHF